VSKYSFVEPSGVGGDQLFALQAIDHEDRSGRPIQVRQLLANSIQALDCAGVVIRVMAEDEFSDSPLRAARLMVRGVVVNPLECS
jgi:hypothetical protein